MPQSIVTALYLVKDMYANGYTFPGAEGLDNDSLRAHFAEGNIGIVTGASWDYGVYSSQFVPSFEWGVCQPLTLEGSESFPECVATETLLTINKQAERTGKVDAAMKVAQFIMSDDFWIPAYEQGFYIPPADIQAKATKDPDPHFKALACMDNAVMVPETPIPMLEVEGETFDNVIPQIIIGLVDTEEALADLDARYNAALDQAIKDGLDMTAFELTGK